MRGTIVENKLEQFRTGVMTDRVHHPLALDDDAHVEVGDENSFAVRQGGNQMGPFRRDNGGHATASQRLAEFFFRRNPGDLFVGQPPG